jgi:hypothetical protein
MGASRASHVRRLRVHAAQIFGSGFEQAWFGTKYARGSVEKLQGLSGAHVTPQGKKYRLLALVLFPEGSSNKKDIFLNPALVNVSVLPRQLLAT